MVASLRWESAASKRIKEFTLESENYREDGTLDVGFGLSERLLCQFPNTPEVEQDGLIDFPNRVDFFFRQVGDLFEILGHLQIVQFGDGPWHLSSNERGDLDPQFRFDI